MKSLVILTFAAACAPRGPALMIQSAPHAGAARFETVMVFTNISDAPFAGSMNTQFENRLRAGLAACNVRSEFRPVVEDGGEYYERMEGQMQAMGTHAALIIKEAGGKVTSYTDRTGAVANQSFDVNVKVELIDRRTGQTTWDALARYRGRTSMSSSNDGEYFASEILAHLRSDGMIACPAE